MSLNHQIITLYTEILKLSQTLDEINTKKQIIKSNEEENNKKLNDKQSEISKVFMAIQNIEKKCMDARERKDPRDKDKPYKL